MRSQFATAVGLVVMISLSACAGFMEQSGGGSSERAVELYGQFEQARAAGDNETASSLAREFVARYPDFSQFDDVLLGAGDVEAARSDFAQAAVYYERLIAGFPSSPLRADAYRGAAAAHLKLGDNRKSAEYLIALLDTPLPQEAREEAAEALHRLVRSSLSAADLFSLAADHPESILAREASLSAARTAYANGDYDECYKLLSELLYRFPETPDAFEARRLLQLAGERRQAPRTESTRVDPDCIGVIFPVTGPASRYGRFFEQGVDLAISEFDTVGRRVKIIKADSHGDAAGAVRAVRKVVVESGAIAMLGAVFTFPTVAAAIEANAWGVPLVSPVVSSNGLDEIGPWVYQAKVPFTVEVSAVASLAATRLGLERFAVIAPVRGERRKLGDAFADEIRRLGGDVVSLQYYDEGATDYRDQLDVIREAAPDAIFAPGAVEELLLLLPQIKFYDLQVQLLGLSNWDSDRLLRLSRAELEGAMFPHEAYHGHDPQAYARFKAAMTSEGIEDVNSIAVSGYFAMRLLLRAHTEGVTSRGDMQRFLDEALRGSSEQRMQESSTIPILVVRDGRAVEFQPRRRR